MKNKFKKSVFLLSSLMMLTVGAGVVSGVNNDSVETVEAEEKSATLTFNDTSKRTEITSSRQVWKNEVITFTNEGSVADYSNPVRLYASSSVTISIDDSFDITEIVFTASSDSYATTLGNSIGTAGKVSGSVVTVDLGDSIEYKFTIEKLTAQVRLNSLTVSYKELSGGETIEPDDSNSSGEGTVVTSNKTYTFSDYTAGTQYAENEEHVLDTLTTIVTTQCHFTSDLRIYSSSAHDGFAIFKFDDSISVSSIGFNAGNSVDKLNVYGSNDDGATWTLINGVAVTSNNVDYTVDFGTTYKSIKLDVSGTNQVRLKTFTIYYTEIDGGSSEPGVPEYVIKYNVNAEKGTLVGDAPTSTTGEVILPNVSVTNEELYEFKGWYIGEDQSYLYSSGQTVTVSDNTTFTALIEDKEVEESDFKLVTDVSTLKVGDRIVIAAKEYNYALSTNQKANNRDQAAVVKTSTGSSINFGDDVQVLTLKKGVVDNTFALYTGEGYLCAANSSNNYLKTDTKLDENGSWLITIADDGTATMVAQGTYTRNTMQYNQSSSLFACYGSANQNAIVLYNGGPDTTCTVTIDVNGGTLDSNVETTKTGDINTGVSGTLPTLSQVTVPSTYASYGITPTFVGWSDGSTIYEPGASYNVNVSTSFKAVYEYDYSYNLSIADAIAICKITGNTNTEFNVTTTGSITEISSEYSSQYNNITVTISDNTNSIEVFRLMGGENLKVGDEITVTGKLFNYNGATPEFAQGCTYNLESEFSNISYQYDSDTNPDAIRFISTINLDADQIESISYRFNKKGVAVDVSVEKIYESINGQTEFSQIDGTYYVVYAISGLQTVKGESFEVTLTVTMTDGTIYTASRSLTLGN